MSAQVCVHGAWDLPNTDWWPKDVRPDAYVKLSRWSIHLDGMYMSEVTGSAIRSHIVADSRSPTFDFCTQMDTGLNHWMPSHRTAFRFDVWDNDCACLADSTKSPWGPAP